MSDDDFDFEDELGDLANYAAKKIRIVCISEREEVSATLLKMKNEHRDVDLTQLAYCSEDLFSLDFDILLIECRVLEALQDLQYVNKVRNAYSLVPIIVLSINEDPDFELMAFDQGASDFCSVELTPSRLMARIRALYLFCDSTKLLTAKNDEVVNAMKNLRLNVMARRQEEADRVVAEKEKSLAEDQVAALKLTKDIMDSLGEAVFVVYPDMKIGHITSAACEAIFGNDIASKDLGDVLGLVKGSEKFLILGLTQLFENIMPMDLNLSLLPQRVTSQSSKLIDLSYRAIQDEDGAPYQVIIVASDVTQSVRDKDYAEKRNALNVCLINILKSFEQFKIFLHDFKQGIAELKKTSDLDHAKRILHTLKGNSAVFKFEELSQYIHGVETKIEDMTEEQFMKARMPIVFEIEIYLRSFLDDHRDIIPEGYNSNNDKKVILEKRHLNYLRDAGQYMSGEHQQEYFDFLDSLSLKPFEEFRRILEQNTQRLADKLEKDIRLDIKGGDILIDFEAYGSVLSNLSHVISNACDHGIELPEERQAKGKDAEGLILMDLKEDEHSIFLDIVDDGNGIDRQKLLAAAISKKYISLEAAQSISPDEVLMLIFKDGLSSAAELSHVSGRGVGMAALKGAVESLGGAIRVRSVVGQGTTISLQLPKQQQKQVAA